MEELTEMNVHHVVTNSRPDRPQIGLQTVNISKKYHFENISSDITIQGEISKYMCTLPDIPFPAKRSQ